MQPETKYAASRDIRIAFQVTGGGPIDVVWAPGTVSHLDLDWEFPAKARFIRDLSACCRLIRFDKRGTGTLGPPAYRRHVGGAHRQVATFDGVEVDTAGDGFLARFDGPTRAVRCASSIGKLVEPMGIKVSSGVHTGEVEAMGSQIRGIAVHIAARVMGKAGPGEVVTSGTVKDLVAGSRIVFEDRGAHSLQGIAGEWRLYKVEHDGTA